MSGLLDAEFDHVLSLLRESKLKLVGNGPVSLKKIIESGYFFTNTPDEKIILQNATVEEFEKLLKSDSCMNQTIISFALVKYLCYISNKETKKSFPSIMFNAETINELVNNAAFTDSDFKSFLKMNRFSPTLALHLVKSDVSYLSRELRTMSENDLIKCLDKSPYFITSILQLGSKRNISPKWAEFMSETDMTETNLDNPMYLILIGDRFKKYFKYNFAVVSAEMFTTLNIEINEQIRNSPMDFSYYFFPGLSDLRFHFFTKKHVLCYVNPPEIEKFQQYNLACEFPSMMNGEKNQ
jgi:hypothetical protein